MLLALIVCFFLYLGIGVFLELTLSPEYGVGFAGFLRASRTQPQSFEETHYPEQDFEAPHANCRPLIRIENVWKVFNSSKENTVVAVRGITMDIYDGQITCLLGHNGAGKSTLIGMMTGMLRPTSGSITISDAVSSFRER